MLKPLVVHGKLVSVSETRIVFDGRRPADKDPGLYEDAIILSGVRAALNAEGPDSTDAIRVASGVVTLGFPRSSAPTKIAAQIEAALGVERVRRVIADLGEDAPESLNPPD